MDCCSGLPLTVMSITLFHCHSHVADELTFTVYQEGLEGDQPLYERTVKLGPFDGLEELRQVMTTMTEDAFQLYRDLT